MTVRAQQPEVLEAIVLVVTIDVVQFQRDLVSQPLRQIAACADALQDSLAQKSSLEFVALYWCTIGQIDVEPLSGGSRDSTLPGAPEKV